MHSCPISWTFWVWHASISHSAGLERWLQFMLMFLNSLIWIAYDMNTIGCMVWWMGMTLCLLEKLTSIWITRRMCLMVQIISWQGERMINIFLTIPANSVEIISFTLKFEQHWNGAFKIKFQTTFLFILRTRCFRVSILSSFKTQFNLANTNILQTIKTLHFNHYF